MTTSTPTKTKTRTTQTESSVVAVACAACTNRVVPAGVWSTYSIRTRKMLTEHGLMRESDVGMCVSCQNGTDLKIWEADLADRQTRIAEALEEGKGLCHDADPEIMFGTTAEQVAEAKRLCGDCPVREACLRAALDSDEQWGTWGGLTSAERLELNDGPINLTQRAIRMGLPINEPDPVELEQARRAEQSELLDIELEAAA